MTKKIIIEITQNGGYIIDSENLECNNTGAAVAIDPGHTLKIVEALLLEEEKLNTKTA